MPLSRSPQDILSKKKALGQLGGERIKVCGEVARCDAGFDDERVKVLCERCDALAVTEGEIVAAHV